VALVAALAATAGLVFRPGLQAGFVSDAFFFVERVRAPSGSEMLGWLGRVPAGADRRGLRRGRAHRLDVGASS
jgi:hypothetical protein